MLAERVADTELAISDRELVNLSVHDVLLELHRRICEDLIPDIAGRWRLRDVRVGDHQAPSYWQVPMLMHDYAADLDIRLSHLDEDSGEQLIGVVRTSHG